MDTCGTRIRQIGNIFTFLLQMDPTNETFVPQTDPTNGYFVPQTDTYVRLTLHSTDSVDSEIVSHLQDLFVGLRFLKKKTHNF